VSLRSMLATGARRAGQDRGAPSAVRVVLTRPAAPAQSNTGARRTHSRKPVRYFCSNSPNVKSIGRAPSNGRIGVCARNCISSSGDSGSVCRASPD
jgi:hypothetical protein